MLTVNYHHRKLHRIQSLWKIQILRGEGEVYVALMSEIKSCSYTFKCRPSAETCQSSWRKHHQNIVQNNIPKLMLCIPTWSVLFHIKWYPTLFKVTNINKYSKIIFHCTNHKFPSYPICASLLIVTFDEKIYTDRHNLSIVFTSCAMCKERIKDEGNTHHTINDSHFILNVMPRYSAKKAY